MSVWNPTVFLSSPESTGKIKEMWPQASIKESKSLMETHMKLDKRLPEIEEELILKRRDRPE